MQEALRQAEIAFKQNEVPVGAVITDRKKGEIIVKSHNIVEQEKNPLLHAEVVAINQACQILKTKFLFNHDIYVTLEPCLMCCCAISFSKIGRIFYAASDPKQGGIESNFRYFNSKHCFHRPEIYSGFLEEISTNLLKDFFKKIRK